MSDKISVSYFHSPYGELILGAYENELCLCDWRYRKSRDTVDNRILKGLKAEFVEENVDVIHQAKEQLREYFSKKRQKFDLPIRMVGTEFQVSVWTELRKIPFGETLSYLALAKQMKNEKAIRAIASANGANALSIIIPCHRIIGSDKKLVGYAGGLRAKQAMLMLEGAMITDQLSLF